MSDRALFFNGQDVGPEDLNYTEAERLAEVDRRFGIGEVGVTAGVLTGFALTNPSAFTINVGAGVGYDDLGRTLRVVSGGSEPLREAPLVLGFAADDAGKLITLAFATNDQTPVDHPVTGTPNDTRQVCYPTAQLREFAAGPNEIVIGASP